MKNKDDSNLKWSQTENSQYTKAKDCLVNQFSSYDVPEIGRYVGPFLFYVIGPEPSVGGVVSSYRMPCNDTKRFMC
jgi:hypothetical protein